MLFLIRKLLVTYPKMIVLFCCLVVIFSFPFRESFNFLTFCPPFIVDHPERLGNFWQIQDPCPKNPLIHS